MPICCPAVTPIHGAALASNAAEGGIAVVAGRLPPRTMSVAGAQGPERLSGPGASAATMAMARDRCVRRAVAAGPPQIAAMVLTNAAGPGMASRRVIQALDVARLAPGRAER